MVTCDISVIVPGRLKTEYRYDPIERTYKTETERVPTQKRSELRVITEGTYKQNGNSIHIEISAYEIEATIKGNQMEGYVTLAVESNQKALWMATRISAESNNSAASNVKESLPPNVIREANGKLRPADGYRWVNTQDPKDLRVELVPRASESEQPTGDIDKERRAIELLKKASHLAYQGNYREAIESYTMVIRLAPNKYEAYLGRAYSKYSINDYRGAIADYDQIIRPFTDREAEIEADIKAIKATYDGLKRALILGQRGYDIYAVAYRNRGLLKEMLGDKVGACDDLRKACELFDGDCKDYNNLCK